jgi:hypothetical protein
MNVLIIHRPPVQHAVKNTIAQARYAAATQGDHRIKRTPFDTDPCTHPLAFTLTPLIFLDELPV